MEQDQQTQAHDVAPEPFTPLPPTPTYTNHGWSWSAFMLGPFFLIGVRKYSWLWFYLLMFVPLLNILFALGFMIVLGMNGKRLVAESTAFANDDERNGFLKGNEHPAKIFVLMYVALIGIFILIMFAFGALIASLNSGDLETLRESAERANTTMEEGAYPGTEYLEGGLDEIPVAPDEAFEQVDTGAEQPENFENPALVPEADIPW